MESVIYRVWFGFRAVLRMLSPPVYSVRRLATFGEREVTRRPAARAPRRFLANVYFDHGQFDDARRHFVVLQSLGAMSATDQGRLAETCYRLGRFSEAVEHFEQLAKHVDLPINHRTHLAMAYVYSGKFEPGLEALQQLIEAVRTAQVYEAMGFAYCSLNKPDRAVPYYERAISIDPENTRLRENFARALVLHANAHLDVGERTSAVALLSRAQAQSVDADLKRDIQRALAQASREDETTGVKH